MAGPSSPWRKGDSPGERFTQDIAARLDLGRVFYKMEQERILKNLDYFQSGSPSRLRTVRYRLDKEVDRAVADVEKFYKKDLDEIYRAGLIGGGLDPEYKLRATDTPNIADLRNQGLRRNREIGERAKARNKHVRDYRKMTRQEAMRSGDQFLNPKIGNVHWNGMVYQTMIIRTDAQKVFNQGVLEGGRRSKVKAFRCIDGPECGLTSHDDPFKVSGELFSVQDARTYTISHPNCVRRWEPVPGESKPPPIGRRKAEFLGTSKALERATELADFISRNVEIDYVALAIDLASDAQMRVMVFNAILRGKDSWVGFRKRIDDLIRKFIGPPPTDDEIFERMVHYIDQMASGEKVPEWVYNILNVRSGDNAIAVGDDFHKFVRVNRVMNATHAELNMMNRLENHYGHFFQARLAAAHPNAADNLIDLYKETRKHYNEPRFHFGNKTISIPRLGGEAFRGPRFTWKSRPIKIQTTLVNKNRHMTREELRAAMMKIGLVPQITDNSGLGGDLLRGMFRHEMIEALGYNPGLLSHVTINPQGLFRMGFRLSPTGWVQPEIRLVPKTIPLRYTARLNRGMPVDGYRIRSVTQEFRAVLGSDFGVDLPNGGRLSLPSVGVSTNTIVGRLETFDDLKRIVMNFTRPGSKLDEQPIERLREMVGFITKGQGVDSIKALDKDQLINILHDWGAGLSGRELLLRNTEVLSLFAELRLSGYNHFHISKILRISPEEALEMINGVKTQLGELWRERSMHLLMQVAAQQSISAIQAGAKYAFVNPAQSAINAYRHTQHILDDFTGWLGTTGKNTFMGRVYHDAIEGYQFIQDFQKGTFGHDLLYRYGPKIRSAKQELGTWLDLIREPHLIDWRKVAQTAIMSPPQIVRFMRDLGVSIGRTIGHEVERSSAFIGRVLSSQGPIAQFFKHANHVGDNVYELNNVIFQADSPGRRGRGFFLKAGAKVSDVLRLQALRKEIAEIAVKHQEEVIAGVTKLRDSAKAVLGTVTKEIRERLVQFNGWLDLNLDEMEEVLSQLAKYLETTDVKLTDEQLQAFVMARKDIGSQVIDDRKVGRFARKNIEKMESVDQEQIDLDLPHQILIDKSNFSQEYLDQFEEMIDVMNEYHSGRRGYRAAAGQMEYLVGDSPQLGLNGYFQPQGFIFSARRFDHGRMVSFVRYPGPIEIEHRRILNTFSHELGHAQDFDYSTNTYVSRVGADLQRSLFNSQKTEIPGLYRSLENANDIVDFDTLADQLIGKDVIILDPLGWYPVRITSETIAQAKFYNAFVETDKFQWMVRKWIEGNESNTLRGWAEADYLQYLMDPAEVWARTYSQSVARRFGTDSDVWKDYIEYSTENAFRQQYTAAEMRQIQKYVDGVLRARGVLF